MNLKEKLEPFFSREGISTYPPLFKIDSKRKLRIWEMQSQDGAYRTISGVVDGKEVISEWRETKPKNAGRANATDVFEQAHSEIVSSYQGKLDSGYTFDRSGVAETVAGVIKPMLADKWENRKDKIEYPVWTQPKFDGIRCIASRHGLFTRAGKPIVSCPHITEQLSSLFEERPDLVLDGELYNHDFKDDFNKIVSLVRKTKPKPEDIEECAEKVEYHVYDVPSCNLTWSNRNFVLFDMILCKRPPSIVPTESVYCESENEVDFQHSENIRNGYEGTIVRTDTLYLNKRSKGLLKYKDFTDEEFPIISIEEGEGNWAGYAKRVIIQLPNGKTATATLKGTQEYCKQVLTERDQYVGKEVTVTYFALTPDGVPRFPVAKALHKEPRI